MQGRSRDARWTAPRVAYDPGCYLCPGNVRASGERNPAYSETFVFTNDFARAPTGQRRRPLETGCSAPKASGGRAG